MELKEVTKELLADGHTYTGWGYENNGEFIPQGCGKKFFSGFNAYGNFVNGILNGPTIVSHDYYMVTSFFKNDRGNGWGLTINEGTLVEFGYYKDSQLQKNLLDFVEWYYKKMCMSGRDGDMLSMYTFNESKAVSELFIGYKGTPAVNGVGLTHMGFRFKSDGSVWVGTTGTRELTGYLINFTPWGEIIPGRYEKGSLIEYIHLQEIIDSYFGTCSNVDDSLLDVFPRQPKSSCQLKNEQVREQFRNIEDIEIEYNYFTNEWYACLP